MDLLIGFDVSLASMAICVSGDRGKIVKEAKVASEPEALATFLEGLSGNVEVVGIEAGPLSQWLHMHLTAAGFDVVRMALFQAATTMSRCGRHNWLGAWALRVASRRGQMRATTALARRIGVVLRRMWRDETEFRYSRHDVGAVTA